MRSILSKPESSISNFERARLEYILQKEQEIKTKERSVKVVADCSNKNKQYLLALENINTILGEINIGTENTQAYTNEQNNYNNINSLINQESIDVEMLSEVPSEYIE